METPDDNKWELSMVLTGRKIVNCELPISQLTEECSNQRGAQCRRPRRPPPLERRQTVTSTPAGRGPCGRACQRAKGHGDADRRAYRDWRFSMRRRGRAARDTTPAREEQL